MPEEKINLTEVETFVLLTLLQSSNLLSVLFRQIRLFPFWKSFKVNERLQKYDLAVIHG